MNRFAILFATVAILIACSTALALYSVSLTGDWPKTWPKELEPLRKQSRTLVGPLAEHRHFAIRFKTRDEFEAAWPHLLTVSTKGAPIFLTRGGNFFLDGAKAGVVVHCPPLALPNDPVPPEAPIAGVADPRMRWMNASYIELVVDGDIVDLNRIRLPADVTIVDERFK